MKTGVEIVSVFSVFDIDGYSKKSGETSFVTILRKDGVDSGVSVSVSEIGSSGDYRVSFTPDTKGRWSLQVYSSYSHDWFVEEYNVYSANIEDIYDMVRRLLGLGHENIFIDNTEYNDDGQLINARVRLFDSKSNCDAATDGGSETTGLLAAYRLDSTWDSVNEFNVFKQTRIS